MVAKDQTRFEQFLWVELNTGLRGLWDRFWNPPMRAACDWGNWMESVSLSIEKSISHKDFSFSQNWTLRKSLIQSSFCEVNCGDFSTAVSAIHWKNLGSLNPTFHKQHNIKPQVLRKLSHVWYVYVVVVFFLFSSWVVVFWPHWLVSYCRNKRIFT